MPNNNTEEGYKIRSMETDLDSSKKEGRVSSGALPQQDKDDAAKKSPAPQSSKPQKSQPSSLENAFKKSAPPVDLPGSGSPPAPPKQEPEPQKKPVPESQKEVPIPPAPQPEKPSAPSADLSSQTQKKSSTPPTQKKDDANDADKDAAKDSSGGLPSAAQFDAALKASALPSSKPSSAPRIEKDSSTKSSLPKKQTKKRSSGRKKRIILLSVLAAAILLFIAGEIWWFFIRPTPEPAVAPDNLIPTPEEVLPPEETPDTTEPEPEPEPSAETPAILSFQSTSFIELTQPIDETLASGLDRALAQDLLSNTLIQLVPQTAANSQLPLDKLSTAFGITIPTEVEVHLTGAYNFFVLTTSPFDEETCQDAGITRRDCAGPRLGLALETRGNQRLGAEMRAWEPTMLQSLRPLVVAEVHTTTNDFQDGTYRGVDIRYRNLPIDTVTLDYAISGNTLLITTSKSSMYRAIDALTR